MSPRINSVVARDDYRLILNYENGEIRVYDVSNLFDKGNYRSLKNMSIFKQVKITFDTVEWPNGLDIDPDDLYVDSQVSSISDIA